MNIALVTDSTSDVPEIYRQKYDIHVVDAYVHFGNETFTSENLSMKEFHEKLETASGDKFPKTSQPSSQDFLEMYESLRDEGYENILSVHVGHEYAGTLNSARNATNVIEDTNIVLVDSHAVSAPLFICLIKARQLIEAGKSMDTIKENIEELGPTLEGYFSLETMENLVKGGRMGKIKYRFGKLLNIKPILKISEGSIKPHDKVRGLDKSRRKAFEYALNSYNQNDEFNYIVAHCAAEELAEEYNNHIQNEYCNATGLIMEIGMAVAVHSGRHALYFMTFSSDLIDMR